MIDPRYEECYRILGLAPDAKPEEVTWAFRKLLVKLHPDRNPGADRSRFDQVVQAYRTLTLMQRANRSAPPRHAGPRPIQPHELATKFSMPPYDPYPQRELRERGSLGVALVPLFVLLACGVLGTMIWAIAACCSPEHGDFQNFSPH